MMKRLTKCFAGICTVIMLCFALAPMTVKAADINVTLGSTDNARSGDQVTARIILSNNPGLSTFAMKLAYDGDYLTYTGATWADTISNNTNNLQNIAEVQGPALNISAIFNSTYSNNETIITLHFNVKQDYTTMPVTLSNREMHDSSYNSVAVHILVDASAGTANPQDTETESESETGNNNSQDGNNNNSQSGNTNNSQDGNNNNSQSGNTNNSQGGNTNNSQGGNTNNSQSGNTNNSQSGSSKPNLDHTPKTGTSDIRYVLGGAIVLFLAVAAICVKILRKKRV